MRSKVHIPVDPETNEARGVRTHEGFEVTKVLDQSTPAIYGALAKPKRWESVQIDTYQVDDNGNEVIAYTDKMEDVAVVSAESLLHNVKDGATKHLPQVDIVTFRYSRITRTWHDGNHTITDDWKASRTGS